MAFSTYTSTNREVEVPLALDYAREVATLVYKLKETDAGSWYRYTRRARKTYRFKGMTEAAAKECLAAKKLQYTRKFMGWSEYGGKWWPFWEIERDGFPFRPKETDYYEQVATFNVIRNTVVYDVQITVDETVALYSRLEYDPNTAAGQALIEANLFQVKSGTIGTWCHVPEYSYDE